MLYKLILPVSVITFLTDVAISKVSQVHRSVASKPTSVHSTDAFVPDPTAPPVITQGSGTR